MTAALSIFLVGMMGAGKSTVGIRLARRLDRPFIDLDRELEARLGVDIPTIFELEGEAGFRRRESQLIDELTATSGRVVATGGGAVLAEANRLALAGRGLVVFLKASPADLWQRLRRDRQRPLLRTENPRQRIEHLVSLRDPFYHEVADLIVATGRQPVEAAVDSILDWLSGPQCADCVAHKRPRENAGPPQVSSTPAEEGLGAARPAVRSESG